MTGCRLVCLLPARNCAHDLPGWFETVARFADAVVALDDGSTDDTRAVLQAEALVRRLLVNPCREGYAGWDDGANRARLLAAAAELSPEWIISLDADERIPEDDAAAMVAFLRGEAARGHAYLMRVHRMVEDLEHFDLADLWVGRLFAFERGQVFSRNNRLHAVPIPTSIPHTRWQRTTIRIQHLAGMTVARRQARYEKYREADPEHRHQRDYHHLLRDPVRCQTWRPRPPCLPVIQNGRWSHEVQEDPGSPVLSAIIIARDDETRIERAVASVVTQEVPEPFEVIAVTSGTDRTAALVRARFPSVRVIELPRPALPGEARNAGLAVARGRYVTFPGSHVELLAGCLAARVRAHRLGYAMVTGTTLNGTPGRAGWAAYFVDHASLLPERPSGPLSEPPTHCSYLRIALEHVGGFPTGVRAGEDTVVNDALFRLGYGAWRAQDARFVHYTPCTTTIRLLKHHFVRGQAYGRILLDQLVSGDQSLLRGTLRPLLLYTPARFISTLRAVRRWAGPELCREWRAALPLVLLTIVTCWVGAWYGLVHRLAQGSQAPRARPGPHRPGAPAAPQGQSVGR